jgi:hypothetical protein
MFLWIKRVDLRLVKFHDKLVKFLKFRYNEIGRFLEHECDRVLRCFGYRNDGGGGHRNLDKQERGYAGIGQHADRSFGRRHHSGSRLMLSL